MYTPEEFLKDLATTIVVGTREGYASGRTELEVKESDGSTSIHFDRGDFHLHDNWFGGEPYGGRIAVLYKGAACWFMGYHGEVSVERRRDDPDQVYAFLLEALRLIPGDMPFRGPRQYISRDRLWRYTCKVEGDILWFDGIEEIYFAGIPVYKGRFLGGEVNLKA